MNPDGEIVAWTTDGWWAAVIVALLNGDEEQVCTVPGHIGRGCGDRKHQPRGAEDSEATAREAISHLAYNGLSVRCELAGDPSDAVTSMVESCFRDGEIAAVLSDLACRYVMPPRRRPLGTRGNRDRRRRAARQPDARGRRKPFRGIVDRADRKEAPACRGETLPFCRGADVYAFAEDRPLVWFVLTQVSLLQRLDPLDHGHLARPVPVAPPAGSRQSAPVLSGP